MRADSVFGENGLDVLILGSVGKQQCDVQAGGDPDGPDGRHGRGQRTQQVIASFPVVRAHSTKMTVEAAALDEVRECQLFEYRALPLRQLPDPDYRLDQP